MKMRKVGCILAVVLAMLTGAGLPVRAAVPGSVELVFPELAAGIEMTLYQAAVYEDGTYRYTEPFRDCQTEPLEPDRAEEAWKSAEALAAYAREKGISGETGQVGEDGTLRFEGLEPAIYLAAQTGGEELLAVQAILIPIPCSPEGETAESYDAVLYPKYEFPGGAVILNKVDEKGNPLAGAYFVLEQKVYAQEFPEGAETGKDEQGTFYWKRFQAEFVSGSSGQITVTGLALGDYRFLETKEPDGYLLSEEPLAFTIDQAGQVKEVSGRYEAQSGTVAELKAVNIAKVPETPAKDPAPGPGGQEHGTVPATGEEAWTAGYVLLIGLSAVVLSVGVYRRRKADQWNKDE